MLKKIKFTKEPSLSVHRYVVAVNFRVIPTMVKPYIRTKFHYCLNLKEVQAVAKSSKKGSWITVHKADHKFVKAYAHE